MDKNSDFSEIYRYFKTPELVGRPNREDPISLDDQLNLRIALALSKDVLDFIEDHHIFME